MAALEGITPTLHKHVRGRLQKLSAEEEQIEAAYRCQSEHSFLCFTRGLVIASAKGPRVFENVMAQFQRAAFEEIASSLEALRDGKMPEKRRWWIERTKKASKDADLAVIILWLLAFPKRPFYIQIGAANKEQANIVKERISHLLHWNVWLNGLVESVQYSARSKKKMSNGQPMAELDIMSADAAGAHGGTPDLLLINELSHIVRWEFAENLMDNADGVVQGMVVVATNAGFRGTKAEVWRKNAIGSELWSVHVLAKPAPWHDYATIEDAKKRNTPSRFKRLWKGVWVSGRGDALQEDAIERAFCLSGPIQAPEDGWEYVAGLDLGVSIDHSGLAVIGINFREQLLKIAWWKAWEPRGNPPQVDLIDVESTCLSISRIFRISKFLYDPHQAVLMAQRLKRQGVRCHEMSFSSPNNLVRMADSFIQVIDAGKFQCYDDEDGRLRRDFAKFNIVEKSYGHRLEAVSDEYGHADVGTAVVICLPYAVDALEGLKGLHSTDDVTDLNDEKLSEKEVKSMPKDLRDIYEMDEEG